VQALCVTRGVSRGGPSALTRFGKTSQCAVPNEVKDASLMLGRTKEGLLGRTDGVERDCHTEHSKGSNMALLRFAQDDKKGGRMTKKEAR